MLTSLRLLVVTMMAAIPVMGLALAFVMLPDDDLPSGADSGPPYLVLGGLVVAAVVVHLLIETTTYRVSAATATDPVGVLRTGTILRASLAQSVALVGLALAFVVTSDGFLVFAVAGVASLVLTAVDAYPGRRQVARTDEALRRAGMASDLVTRLGVG